MTPYAKYLTLAVCLAVVAACSTTRQIPDDDQLFVGLKKIEYNLPDPATLSNEVYEAHIITTQEEVEVALATAPNGALFGSSYYRSPFPIGLWVWNYANGSSGKFKQFLNKIFGTQPVLMSQVNPALRASVAQSVLRKNGFLHGSVTYREVPQKNPKKMKIGYTVTLDTLFTIDTLAYVNFPPQMQALIDSTSAESGIRAGAPFSVSTLDAERTRISRLFRNNGYYYYQPSYATFLADTFEVQNRVQLRLQLADSLPAQVTRPWHIGNIKMQLRNSTTTASRSTSGPSASTVGSPSARNVFTDSISRSFLKIFYSTGKKYPPIRPRVLLRDLQLRPRRLYRNDDYTRSVQKLNATGIFTSVDLQLNPRTAEPTPRTSYLEPRTSYLEPRTSNLEPRTSNLEPRTSYPDTLDLTLNCTFDKPYDVYVETNFINRTIGRMGPELKLGVKRRNLFRGGEILDINLHGSYEWQTNSEETSMSTYQYGADGSIEFPRILLPRLKRRVLPSQNGTPPTPRKKPPYASPSTILKLSTDIIRRPDYYKMHIVSGEWTYRWQPTESSRHEFSPITLKYQYMNTRTEKFEQMLEANPYLLVAMDDYFIPKMRYTYNYQTRHTRWDTTIEESGNVTALYDMVIQGYDWQQKDKTLFKNPYSQFIKIETDLTKTWNLDNKSQLVGHLNAGLMWSYGNSTDAPFSERFYVGGANTIRAFTARSIGPGAYSALGTDSRQIAYLLRNGDSKLIMNLEYRRQLAGNLYGAVFLDAGNVWSTSDYTITEDDLDPSYPYAKEFVALWNKDASDMKFKLSRFFTHLATGTGLGLRYDLEFLVIRLDWGFGLHVPYDTGRSSYFNISRFRDMHSLHFAVGYPF